MLLLYDYRLVFWPLHVFMMNSVLDSPFKCYIFLLIQMGEFVPQSFSSANYSFMLITLLTFPPKFLEIKTEVMDNTII